MYKNSLDTTLKWGVAREGIVSTIHRTVNLQITGTYQMKHKKVLHETF